MRKFTLLKTRKAETLLHDIEQIQKRITERAYDVFQSRGAALGAALNDWPAFTGRPLISSIMTMMFPGRWLHHAS